MNRSIGFALITAIAVGVLFGPTAGIIVGVVMIAISLIVISNRQGVNKESSSDQKKCPYCAELIKEDAMVCRYCGKDVSDILPEAITCPFCNEVHYLDNKERIEKKFICPCCDKLVDMTQVN
ncbi:MAG: zinc ribbon domain-containing protein [Anaerolineaceae bacterium]